MSEYVHSKEAAVKVQEYYQSFREWCIDTLGVDLLPNEAVHARKLLSDILFNETDDLFVITSEVMARLFLDLYGVHVTELVESGEKTEVIAGYIQKLRRESTVV